ncbi:MAG TPA: hypothetical protein VI504_00765 [Candidatus Eisenbacteria bacterium]|jgi:hypothetical protein
MSVATRKSSIVLLAALAVAAMLGLGACSRSNSVSDSLMGPSRGGAGSFQNGLPNAALSSVSLAPASVTGGASSAGTVTLTSAAPSGGLVVKLASNRAGVSVPGQITVAAGATSGGFTVTTSTVTATTSASISANLGGVTVSATLTITAGGVAPPPPPVAVNPCTSLTGLSATVVNATASVPQFRATRLRVEISGDTPTGTINTLGGCAPVAAPAVSFISGTGSLTRGGASVTATGAALTFGPLLFPGLALEPGVVIATDGAGNVLEIVWPALSGLAPGPPILRLQLAQRNASVATGDVLATTMTFVARAPDGSTATFTASASGLVVPALK